MTDTPIPGWLGPTDPGSLFNAMSFLIDQALAGAQHVTIVQVKAVHGGGVAAPATVDVQPCIAQVDQVGNAQVHGTIYGMPCLRTQGGANAIIIDPIAGDLGVVVFADRDISSALANQGPANPGSFRRFDWADGIYIGSVGNTTPTNFVEVQKGNITVTSTGNVTVNAPTMATVNGPTTINGATVINGTLQVSGAVTGNSTAAFVGDVTGGAISLESHVHGGVTTGGADTSPPL
jgi:hypothetical protein